MLVVSNTSPLRYLVEVLAVNVLPKLYSQVYTTPQVISELQLGHFPEPVRQWAQNPPAWLQVQAPITLRFLDRLDDGEASALSLACDLHASVILMDERAGRDVARSLGLEPRGTLGVIARAGACGHLDFETTIRMLTTQTRFRHTPELIEDARRQYEATRRELRELRPDANPPR